MDVLTPKLDPPALPPGAPVPVPEQPVVPHADSGGTSTVPPVASAQHRYRVLLRVGEGEPNFEVKCGDELVLKVICERVDMKSPEKGSEPMTLKASGRVRFAGFGAEGICDELTFQAGTAEVLMAGKVNIRVKDKLGRVESEFSTEAAKYKLDPCPPLPRP
jgi:hypothetical protein